VEWVNTALGQIMSTAYKAVREQANRLQASMQKAALMVGINRVARAVGMRGSVP
jgi:glutamate dehydrogenase/leucine dehydrogenase